MSILASSVVTKVRDNLIDPDGVRWSDDELLRWLTDAQRAVVAAVPNASTSITTHALIAGPRQTIPSDGFKVLDIYRNLSLMGVSGNAIQEEPFDLFRLQYPDWTSSESSDEVKAFAQHPDDPTVFYIYPANDATGAVELNYSVMPPALAALGDTLAVRDIFEPSLVDYVMSRAHAKDSDYAGGENVTTKYLNQFTAFVSTQMQPGG